MGCLSSALRVFSTQIPEVAVRRYFAAGLDRFPDLRFNLHGVLTGVDSLTIVYTSVADQKAAEVMVLRDGLAVRVHCHYGDLRILT